MHDEENCDRKEQVGRKRSEELDNGLDPLGQVRAQPDTDTDRNPYRRGKPNENGNAEERERAIAGGGREIIPRERGSNKLDELP